jgi:ribosome-associated protein
MKPESGKTPKTNSLYRIMNTVLTLPSLSEGTLMEDMLETEIPVPAAQTASAANAADALGDLLREHKGGDIAVLDLREQASWTDFFVIATASSNTHMDGMERHIKTFCDEREISILRRSRKPNAQEDEWRIIDLGSIVVHLMSRRARDFYELERLYSLKP